MNLRQPWQASLSGRLAISAVAAAIAAVAAYLVDALFGGDSSVRFAVIWGVWMFLVLFVIATVRQRRARST